MKEQANAKIQWLSAEEGGRQAPPTGRRYVTVAEFDQQVLDASSQSWSLQVESTKPLDNAQCVFAHVSFLFPERAPNHLLMPGARFRLLEGGRIVAVGQIIKAEEALQTMHNGTVKAGQESPLHTR
jgi:hypothetical protein